MSTKTKKIVVQRCAKCNRRMKVWVFSRHTGRRYCWPGEGCSKQRKERA